MRATSNFFATNTATSHCRIGAVSLPRQTWPAPEPDPATDARNNDNLSVDFLIAHYNLAADPAIGQRLASINSKLQAFRKKILPARHKFISHHDRNAILAGNALGAASNCEWDEFWSGLQQIVSIVHEKVLGSDFDILNVSMLSDADRLLEALWREACFEELMSQDSALANKFWDMVRS